MAEQEPGANVKYCGVARNQDKIILASVMNSRADIGRYNARVKELMSKGQIAPSKANSLEFEDGKLHFTSDSSCAYYVATAQTYPSRTAFQMLNAFQRQFKELYGNEIVTSPEDGLTRKAKPELKKLLAKYDDINSVDKITAVNNQVNQVKNVMSENIQIMLSNQDNLEHLHETTDMLTKESKAFQKKATTVKRNMWCKNVKMTIILSAIVVIVIVVIVVSIVSAVKH